MNAVKSIVSLFLLSELLKAREEHPLTMGVKTSLSGRHIAEVTSLFKGHNFDIYPCFLPSHYLSVWCLNRTKQTFCSIWENRTSSLSELLMGSKATAFNRSTASSCSWVPIVYLDLIVPICSMSTTENVLFF